MIAAYNRASKKVQIGKYVCLEYVEVEGIEDYLPVFTESAVFVGQLTLKNGYSWKTMPQTGAAPWETSNKESKQGDLTEVFARGMIYTNVDNTSESISVKMKRTEFAVRIVLSDGLKLLIATPQYPAQFSYKTEGGDQGVNLRRISFSFKSQLLHPILNWNF